MAIRPIRFKTPAEFQSRRDYVPTADCTEDDLESIVGKYADFSKADELICGLNRCGQPHQNGVVIRLKDGRETHCGHECALSFFKLVFKDINDEYQAAVERTLRSDNIRKNLEERDLLLPEARQISQALKATTDRIRLIREVIEKDPGFLREFDNVLRSGGAIQVEKRIGKDARDAMGIGGRGTERIMIGRVESIEAFRRAKTIYAEFRHATQGPLERLDGTALESMTDDEIKNTSAELTAMREAFRGARLFLDSAERFCSADNRAQLAKIAEVMTAAQRTGRVARVLEGLKVVGSKD